MESKTLSPFVYWAQTEKEITLKIDLRNVKSPDIDVQDHVIYFNAVGVGNQGQNTYGFQLDLMYAVDPEATIEKVTPRNVELRLTKQDPKFWPRLLHENLKPAWLKIDFDKWMHEEDLQDEARDILEDFPGLYNKMKASETGSVLKPESLKKVYLFLYNLWLFVGFLYIVVVLLMRYASFGAESLEGSYKAVGWMMHLCFLTQFLEILHPIVGYTKGSPFEAIMQVCGRGVVFFCLIEAEPRMQTKPVVFFLFFVWSIIEVVRYPFYMLRVYNMELGLLTWLRYSLWIPLYPVGFMCEGIVILRSIPYVEETERFSVALPNSWNFAFHFPSLLRIYLLFFFLPAMYKMMNHMYNQRLKKFSRRSTAD
ncbi:very-long-chain (3R)-3-hydroxyacyl-CoA dehydratase 3-like [Hyalella azteca]|uniref:Very-long-chain (3R)-3-hydroxyacyl-CoA dehydratase n=2 Tax=Hyalella azteca TaxID=294128 RepID=A0A8B7NK93_HYAAZ|nr:very-long-chain (3R)-3-hydroxyacyl-CoA dehydratase 3-like [Hyalella azteca]